MLLHGWQLVSYVLKNGEKKIKKIRVTESILTFVLFLVSSI